MAFSRPSLSWFSDGSAPGSPAIEETVVGGLVPVADELRDLQAFFGVLPWRCWLVWVRWSGQKRGEGTATVLQEVELLPSPTVRERRNRRPDSGGTRDTGEIELDGISLVYTEDQLLGRGTGGAPVDRNVDFFWELRPRDAGDRVRLLPVSVRRDWEDVCWSVSAQVQLPARGRTGVLP